MQNIFSLLARFILEPSTKQKVIFAFIVMCLLGLGGYVVYTTGGTKLSYLHFMYLPIIAAGFYFGPLVGIGTGALAAFIVGPFMPESVENQLDQSFDSWLFRSLFFTIIGWVAGIFSKITADYYHTIQRQNFVEPVTGLHNYRGLFHIVEGSRNKMQDFAGVVAVKVKQMGEIDRAFGPESSEELMRQIARSISQATQDDGYAACIDPSKFVTLVKKEADLRKVLFRCRQTLNNDLKLKGVKVFVELYYALADTLQGDNLNDILRKASNAVERGMEHNIIECQYSPDADEQTEKNLYILRELKTAFEKDSLTLNYQPKVNLATGQIVGMEALARWPHPELGMVSPMQFMGIAEKTLLINPYTKWLMRKALGQLALWRDNGYPVTLALNFSMKNFQDPSVIESLFECLKEFKLPPELVEIEITESALSTNLSAVADILRYLQERRIRIAIDDFGTGLSSLNYLFELPVDVIKVDKTFVQAMTSNSAAEAILRSAITLGHELNLEVVAEGIETQEQYDLLNKIGCQTGQGYYIARPMPEELATAWLESKKSHLVTSAFAG